MYRIDYRGERERLIEGELRRLGIRDERVLQAMRTVPREEFVPEELREFAYRNAPLPIAAGQTISQPLVVAHMAEALRLKPSDRVLEVGAGSGYAAAVLSRIARDVHTIERHPELAETAAERLQHVGYDNVHVTCGDGTLGWPEHAPRAIARSSGLKCEENAFHLVQIPSGGEAFAADVIFDRSVRLQN